MFIPAQRAMAHCDDCGADVEPLTTMKPTDKIRCPSCRGKYDANKSFEAMREKLLARIGRKPQPTITAYRK